MHKIGLKVWSTNISYIIPAAELYKKKLFNYIELYVVPSSIKEYLKWWRSVEFPFFLHAPHSYSGFNLSLRDLESQNRLLLKEIDSFRIALNPKQVIFHTGIKGSIDETVRQIKLFKNEFPKLFDIAILENKPKLGINNELCICASPDEMKIILLKTGLGFCLDMGHAIYYSAWAETGWEKVINLFMKLGPNVFHLSDGDINSKIDLHLNFGKGNFDLCRIIQMIPSDAYLSIETKKNSKLNLNDFERDVKNFNKCIKYMKK